ncbi:leucine-rich repeat-containing protein 61 [Plakobranchus ocellatus]|uniref:Leucine-rich repeat-containing protein 61 n=1 Tax=Plakobranchus ocellatus TaxID=259542 RepID=A0AAV3YD84_9GAST|nr:leucine-rich repeat-containing protein 61 [Plakobranchus ocellatus]
MASVEPDTGGVVTRQLLKSKSGEFDVESIHTISLHDLGLHDLGCLSECTNLERLDLSRNNVARLHKLAGLIALTALNLSANRITSLDGLQSLENLQKLNISGNLIGSVDSLRCLTALEKLTSLRVCDDTAGLTNPMCNSSYIDQVLLMLPTLLNLDGKRVRGRGSELFQLCQAMDSAISNLPTLKHSSEVNVEEPCKLSIPSDMSLMLESQNKIPVLEAEEQLRALLASCRADCREAYKKLAEGTKSSISHAEDKKPDS